MNGVQRNSPSLPTKSATALSITPLCMLTLTEIHANWLISGPKCSDSAANVTCCSHKAMLRSKNRRCIKNLALVWRPVSRFFQHSLVSLTGSDVAILTVEMFCPCSASASLTNHSHTYGSRVGPCRGGWYRPKKIAYESTQVWHFSCLKWEIVLLVFWAWIKKLAKLNCYFS